MARNRGIKIINEILLENPRAYPLLPKNPSIRRPMTVNYQAPIERDMTRPYTSHLKSKPTLVTEHLRVLPPPPSIRKISELQKMREIPKNTGSSLLNELSFKPRKNETNYSLKPVVRRRSSKVSKKTSRSSSLRYKMKDSSDNRSKPKDTRGPNCGKIEIPKKGLPDKPGCTDAKKVPKRTKDGKPCKICIPEPICIKNTTRLASPVKKIKVPMFHRLKAAKNVMSVDEMIRERVEQKCETKPFEVNLEGNVHIEGSKYVIDQLRSIKTELLGLDKKISMRDASMLISDIKSRISKIYKEPSQSESVLLPVPERPVRTSAVKKESPNTKAGFRDQAAYRFTHDRSNSTRNPNHLNYERRTPAKTPPARVRSEKNPLQEFPASPLRDYVKITPLRRAR